MAARRQRRLRWRWREVAVVVVTVTVVIVTAAAPIDDAHLYSSWRRVARGGVAVAVECRAAGARDAYISTGETGMQVAF